MVARGYCYGACLKNEFGDGCNKHISAGIVVKGCYSQVHNSVVVREAVNLGKAGIYGWLL